jgi:hypothetical protein
MKYIYLLTGILICCCSFSNCDEVAGATCDAVIYELVFLDPDLAEAKNHINSLLMDLPPVATVGDPIGHEENLNTFVERFNQSCALTAVIECYGCIETFPVQSHVTMILDSAGVKIHRTLDILTPGEALMTLRGVHR